MSASFILAALLSAPASPQSLLRQLLRDPALRGAFVGVYVTDRSGRVLVQYQGDRMMMPASNQKLLSCGFAVAKLGWNHRHTTKIWRRDPVVWIQAGNDPLLSSQDLVAACGGRYDRANVVLPYPPQYGMGWEIDDRVEPYLPKVSPLAVDGGLHTIRYGTGRSWLEPPNPSLSLELAQGAGAARALFDFEKGRITLKGSWPAQRPLSIPQPEPVAVAASLVAGNHEIAITPPSEPADVVVVGRPVVDAVRICMIESDNRIAETLLMSAGGKTTIRGSAEAMEKFWVGQGVRKGEIRAVDGSGLSRHNLVTARALNKVMHVAIRRGIATKRALATPGQGTLRRRFQGLRFAGKTGTLDTLTCLTGVLEGKGIVLSVLVNHAVSPVHSTMAAVDRFVKGLASYYAVGTKDATSSLYDPYTAQPSNLAAYADWLDGPRGDGHAALPRTNRGVESAHAADH